MSEKKHLPIMARIAKTTVDGKDDDKRCSQKPQVSGFIKRFLGGKEGFPRPIRLVVAHKKEM